MVRYGDLACRCNEATWRAPVPSHGRCANARPVLESTTFLLATLLRLRVAALGATLGCGTGREEAAPGCSERRAVRIGDFGRAPQPHRSLPLGVRWALRGSAAQPPECTAQPAAWRARHRETEQRLRGTAAARMQHAAVPLHHGGVAEELEPALAPQRPQCAHLLGSAGVPSSIVRGLVGTR